MSFRSKESLISSSKSQGFIHWLSRGGGIKETRHINRCKVTTLPGPRMLKLISFCKASRDFEEKGRTL